ncbi:hypothetical protein EO98_03410 [Methanosarcina sp. 2.H.T.1A.6]|uniref:hypothetical protein n=1 Tax=unclassified Methanosarcina TaxID=2644672 RepID=UPI0006226F53|nr:MULTISPECIES: hypothetical protein [unclassified Methanosarcina]KKG17517.1 hypothetical protein EO97_04830 [Methanosarcina sp. 2.H.T.1A.15]KKG18438.1 hypothetical protein EO94_04460 [Methanosarcina sp. 2.H.T.1A.3]KKG20639.1 hypothetical protein EO98_03410 [Methanosarcina sp. 2.H.T.1A.6]KKG23199.1 hypothetical protein EO96_01935 [Methanosarcina sp. 2.H.T.1A.8]
MFGEKSASSKVDNAKEALSDCHKPYIESPSFEAKTSSYLIFRYGEPNLLFFCIVSAGVGIALFIIGSELQSRITFFLGIPFLLLAAIFYQARDYYLSRICKKCGREFAYVQTRKPVVYDDWSQTIKITSYYRCRYCGHKYMETKSAISAYVP